jgi:hypothetical protein
MSESNDKPQTSLERRRTQRVSIAFRIEVCGREPEGVVFQDETKTIDVNENGCKFDLTHQLNSGDLLSIRYLTRGQTPTGPILFQIVWVKVREDGRTVGAMRLQDKIVWPMKFPAKPSPQHSA